MEYAKLGRTDLTVSRICLGCMGFGDAKSGQHAWTLPYEESAHIIEHALEKGVNFFDTAMSYQGGTSEEYVGRALRSCARREDIVVATKFTLSDQSEKDRTKEPVLQKVGRLLDASLSRLGMDYVDLYIYHMWDWDTPIEELLEALDAQVRLGKVRAIGVSNCFAWQLAEANQIAKDRGLTRFASYQGHYNAIAREDEREMVPYARLHDIALTPYSALAAGRLSRKPGAQSERLKLDAYARGKYEATQDLDAPIIRAIARIAEERGVSMTEVSLAWLQTKVCAPVVGATKACHIDGAVAACDIKLTADELAMIEDPYIPHDLVGVLAQNIPNYLR